MKNIFKRFATGFKNVASTTPEQESTAQHEARKSMVNSTHVGQWSKNKFTVINIASGQAEVTLELDEQISEWVSGAITRQESKWNLTIARGNSPRAVPVGAFDDARQAGDEFERIAGGLVLEFFDAKEVDGKSVKQTGAVKSARGRIKRFVFALGPWVGGGVAVILFSLVMTSGGPKGNAVASVDLNVAAPAAWGGLSAEQRETLLKITEQAAKNYSGREQAGLREAIANSSSMPQAVQSSPSEVKVADKLTPDQMTKIKASTSLKIGSGKKSFYSFEDPNCSACQHFAVQSRKLGAPYSVTVLPVAFQKGGRDKAAAALCAANPVQAWSDAMEGGLNEGKPCDAGYKKVDANNALFLALGMKATPTLVAGNGAVNVGSSETVEIAKWVDANGK